MFIGEPFGSRFAYAGSHLILSENAIAFLWRMREPLAETLKLVMTLLLPICQS